MATKTWLGTGGGSWTTDANWSPTGAATALDTATINGPAPTYQVVTGTGSSIALTLTGNTLLSGTFNVGVLGIGTVTKAGGLGIGAGTVVVASAATVADGLLLVAGAGAKLVVGGALTIGAAATPYSYNFIANTLTLAAGASVQVGSLAMLGGALVTDTINVDATSTLEIGALGAVALGKVTVDAGRMLSGAGTIAAANGIANAGTILAQGGVLRVMGAIGGAGQMQVGANATLDLSAAGLDTGAVGFTAATGTLVVRSLPNVTGTPNVSALNQQGTIAGFVQGDTISYSGAYAGAPGALTGVTYQAGSGGLGTLTLQSGATTLGTLRLAGNYAGYSFQVTPGASTSLYNITLAAVASSGPAAGAPASAGTSGPDSYVWTGSGSWALATNWRDATLGATAAVAPGANNLVTLAGPATASYQVISGPGNSAGLTLTGNNALNGVFNTGALAVGTVASAAALYIGAGSVVVAGSVTLLDGPALVSGAGARLIDGGALIMGSPPTAFNYNFVANALTVSAGGAVQAGSLSLLAGALETNAVSVDAASTLEIGAQGGAAQGKLTIDAGRMVIGTGTITAANGVMNQGTLLAQGGTLRINGAIGGAGQVQIGAGGTLDLSNAASVDTDAVVFTATNGTLLLGSAGPAALTQQGTVSGFLQGDIITYFGLSAPLTAATYRYGSNGLGTLTLTSGLTTLGSLILAGDYRGDGFQVSPGGSPYRANITLTKPAADTVLNVGTPTPDVYAWTGASSGNWNDAKNWRNVTTAAAAAVAPGANNVVTLANLASGPAVSGPGISASLTVAGATTLNGAFNTGALGVGTATAAASLTIATGAAVTASSGWLANGQLQVVGNGAQLTAKGTLTLGASGVTSGAASLALSAGGTMQADGIAMLGGSRDTIAIDAASTLELGTLGGAAAGKLTIDVGHALTGAGSVGAYAGIVDRGTILAQGGTLDLTSAVSGYGQMHIGAHATLSLDSAAVSTAGVTFDSNSGTLALRSSSSTALNEQGLISEFAWGDTISYSGSYSGAAPLTSVGFLAGNNVLTLNGATGVIGTLALAGSYSGYTFQVTPGAVAGTSNIGLVISDPLFDIAYYLAQNPDVAAAGIDPYFHYMNTGWHEGRNPNAYFDSTYYLTSNPDVRSAMVNPLTHFETDGWAEGRQPSLTFSDSAYLAAAPDVAAAGDDPLVHYLEIGKSEGRSTALPGFDGNLAAADPLVNAAYYDAQLGATLIPAGAAGQAQAAEMYHSGGWKAGLNPDAWFDTSYYLAQNPDVKASGVDPLTQFETVGAKQGRDPSLLFSVAKYNAARPDVAAAGMNPLLHYINIGLSEGAMAFLTGGVAAADPLVDAAYYDRQLGATILPTGTAAAQQAAASYDAAGWQKGLNPDAWFDTNYYLSHNPDVAAAHIDPLTHYENQGWLEGRDPSAAFSTNKYLAAYPDTKVAGQDPLWQFITAGQSDGRQAFHV